RTRRPRLRRAATHRTGTRVRRVRSERPPVPHRMAVPDRPVSRAGGGPAPVGCHPARTGHELLDGRPRADRPSGGGQTSGPCGTLALLCGGIGHKLWFCITDHPGGSMDDSVAKDAKRLLLRYGAPISVVDQLSDDQRITVARSIIRTAVAERPAKLRAILSEAGFLESN